MTKDTPRQADDPRKDDTMDGSFQLDNRDRTAQAARLHADTFPRETRAPYDDVPAFDVRRLVGSGTTAHMVLDGQTYCLRITRSGKLILTK